MTTKDELSELMSKTPEVATPLLKWHFRTKDGFLTEIHALSLEFDERHDRLKNDLRDYLNTDPTLRPAIARRLGPLVHAATDSTRGAMTRCAIEIGCNRPNCYRLLKRMESIGAIAALTLHKRAVQRPSGEVNGFGKQIDQWLADCLDGGLVKFAHIEGHLLDQIKLAEKQGVLLELPSTTSLKRRIAYLRTGIANRESRRRATVNVRPEEATRTIEGVVARIGIIRHMEDGVSYGIHLTGVKGMFVVTDRIGKLKHHNVWLTNPHITMASRGDRVRFGVKPSEPEVIVDFFDNETYATDIG